MDLILEPYMLDLTLTLQLELETLQFIKLLLMFLKARSMQKSSTRSAAVVAQGLQYSGTWPRFCGTQGLQYSGTKPSWNIFLECHW